MPGSGEWLRKTSERLSLFSPSFTRRSSKNRTSSDSKREPIDQAREIQSDSMSRKRGGRENHKRPSQLESPFGTPGARVSRKRHRSHTSTYEGTHCGHPSAHEGKSSQSVELCGSNSDTESDNDTRKIPVKSKQNASKTSNIKSMEQRSSRTCSSHAPTYPKTRMPPPSSPDEKQLDDDAKIFDKDCSKRKKRREAPGVRLDTNTASLHGGIEQQNTKAKKHTSQTICEVNRPLGREMNANDMKIPRLKNSTKRRQRHYVDVEDTTEDSDFDTDKKIRNVKCATQYLDNMKQVLDSCESEIGKSKLRSEHSALRARNTRLRLVQIPKVNNKKNLGKKIVPGKALELSRSRRTNDQDEYHTSKKDKPGDSNYWNPVAGESYSTSNPMFGAPYTTSNRRMTRHSKQNETSAEKSIGESQAPRRWKKPKKQKVPETIDICSSESEDDAIVITEKEESDENKFNLKRLAIEKKVYNSQDHGPAVTMNDEKAIMEISFSKNVEEKISICMPDIEEASFWTPGDAATKNYPDDLDSFIWMRSDVTMESMSKRRGSNSTKDKKLVLEFEDDRQMKKFLEFLGDHVDPVQSAPPDDVEGYAQPLIADSKKKYKLRNKGKFISGKPSDEILLVYPFEEDINTLDNAAKGLRELSWKEEDIQDPVPSQRSHFIEVRVEDYERLDTGQWLNDSLVDMWMLWISRHCNRSSNVHFFTSHFFTTLASEGVDGVKSWTAKKNIDIFEKKLIFIPINKTLHWSLCVVVNPGAIKFGLDEAISVDMGDDEDQQFPCVLFFDSLNMHRKGRIHTHLVNWLNSEWGRKMKTDAKPFSKQNCKIYDPEVPRQNNGSDCGVFACRYAFAMFQLRHQKFSRREAGLVESSPRRHTRSRQIFADLITNGEQFNFGVEDIQRIRWNFKALIRQLHPLYKAAKASKIKAEKEEKRARKWDNEKAASIESEAAETSSVPLASKNIPSGASNELSDSSSKENFIPQKEGDEPSQKMPKSNVEDGQADSGSSASGTFPQQSSLKRQEVNGGKPPHPFLDYDSSEEKVQAGTRSTSSLVKGEEMADNDNIVHV